MKALWLGEIVTVVSVKNGKVQIARACGLRWVRPDELTRPRGEVALAVAVALARLRSICEERDADYAATLEGLQ